MESTPSDEAPKLPMLVPQAPRRCPPRPRRPPWTTQADEPDALRPATDQGKRLAVPGALAPVRWLRAEGQIQLTVWKTSRRVVSARTLQNVVPAAGWAECWDQHKHEFAPCVTGLPDEVNCWQISGLNRQRANTKNVLDELKNRRGRQRLLCEVQSDDQTHGATAALRLQPVDVFRALHCAAKTYRSQTRSMLGSFDCGQARAIGSAKRTQSLYKQWLGFIITQRRSPPQRVDPRNRASVGIYRFRPPHKHR